MNSFTNNVSRTERTKIHPLGIYYCYYGVAVRNGVYVTPYLGMHIVDDFGNLVPVVLNEATLSG